MGGAHLIGFSQELELAKRAAKLSGEKILEIYNSNEQFQSTGDNPTTKADELSNEIILRELKNAFPYEILSEELKNKINITEVPIWVIDPLDGTKDFINRTGEFCVMISLVKSSVPILGVVYLPTSKKLYFAEKGKGSYLELYGSVKKLAVSKDDTNYRPIISKNHFTEQDAKFAEFIGAKEFSQKGSIGIKLTEIAENNANVYYNFDGLNKWDICAPQIILEEAGGNVFDLDHAQLDYKIKDTRFRNGIIALKKDDLNFFSKLNNFLKKEEGRLIWITGLAGSGKTTLAKELLKSMKTKYPNTVHLDGDNMRAVLGEDKVHDLASRERTAQIYSRMASLLIKQGINVIWSTISLFHFIHDLNRNSNKYYHEILLDVPESVLKERKKELYKRNDIVGREHIPEFPKNPSLVLKNEDEKHIKENVQKIMDLLEKKMPDKKWDYTDQAKYYYLRPNYTEIAINMMLGYMKADSSWTVADIGAGTGNLTVLLKNKFNKIVAIEPTKAMIDIGIDRTKDFANIIWKEGTGEETGLESNSINLVTFGSSFNTTDREQALKETHRILKKGGFFACMWNNRDLTISTQKKVEEIIRRYYPEYSHGTRREAQADFILQSGLFNDVHFIEVPFYFDVPIEQYIDTWRSVKNQFWDEFPENIIKDIRKEFNDMPILKLKYFTRIWIARKKEENGAIQL